MKQREDREALGLEWRESDYVFSRYDGTPFHPDTVSHAFADIVKKAGVPMSACMISDTLTPD